MKYIYSHKIRKNKHLVVMEMTDDDLDDIESMVILDLEKLDKFEKKELQGHIIKIHKELEKIYKQGD